MGFSGSNLIKDLEMLPKSDFRAGKGIILGEQRQTRRLLTFLRRKDADHSGRVHGNEANQTRPKHEQLG